jgi:hypothetical protein
MGGKNRTANEGIGYAGSIATVLTGTVARPESRTAGFTDLPGKSLFLKIIKLVFFFKHQTHVRDITIGIL